MGVVGGNRAVPSHSPSSAMGDDARRTAQTSNIRAPTLMLSWGRGPHVVRCRCTVCAVGFQTGRCLFS
eukprot:4046597-Prymnesium_polylepis.2